MPSRGLTCSDMLLHYNSVLSCYSNQGIKTELYVNRVKREKTVKNCSNGFNDFTHVKHSCVLCILGLRHCPFKMFIIYYMKGINWDFFIYWYCVQYLYIGIVFSISILVLCSISLYWYCVLYLYIGIVVFYISTYIGVFYIPLLWRKKQVGDLIVKCPAVYKTNCCVLFPLVPCPPSPLPPFNFPLYSDKSRGSGSV